MFVRVTKRWGSDVIKVLHSYRIGTKPKHYIVAEFKDYDEDKYISIKKNIGQWKAMKRAPVIIDEITKTNAPSKKRKHYNNIRAPRRF
jgi:hypothetical protein